MAEGKEETTKELILSMVKNNLSLDKISKITNKTSEEIKKDYSRIINIKNKYLSKVENRCVLLFFLFLVIYD